MKSRASNPTGRSLHPYMPKPNPADHISNLCHRDQCMTFRLHTQHTTLISTYTGRPLTTYHTISTATDKKNKLKYHPLNWTERSEEDHQIFLSLTICTDTQSSERLVHSTIYHKRKRMKILYEIRKVKSLALVKIQYEIRKVKSQAFVTSPLHENQLSFDCASPLSFFFPLMRLIWAVWACCLNMSCFHIPV